MIDLELREKVARLMGWEYDPKVGELLQCGVVQHAGIPGKSLAWLIRYGVGGIPAYETDIAAAWDVVEKMREMGFEFDCCQEPNGVCWARFTHADGRTSAKYVSTPMPLAICRAALAAVEASNDA